MFSELERLSFTAGNNIGHGDWYYRNIFEWCKSVYRENDRLFDLFHIALHDLKGNTDKQKQYLENNIQHLADILGLLPRNMPEFNERFITENIMLLMEHLEGELKLLSFGLPCEGLRKDKGLASCISFNYN